MPPPRAKMCDLNRAIHIESLINQKNTAPPYLLWYEYVLVLRRESYGSPSTNT